MISCSILSRQQITLHILYLPIPITTQLCCTGDRWQISSRRCFDWIIILMHAKPHQLFIILYYINLLKKIRTSNDTNYKPVKELRAWDGLLTQTLTYKLYLNTFFQHSAKFVGFFLIWENVFLKYFLKVFNFFKVFNHNNNFCGV